MTMDQPIPKRLKKEPLLEALWEVRFGSDKESVVELLPGLIYRDLSSSYPEIRRLPVANLPPRVIQQDAALRYIPTVRLQGDRYSIQIGEHAVSLSCPRPYTGWEEFSKSIRELADLLKGTNLLTRPERFSLKYIDVIPSSDGPTLEPLEIELKLGTHELINLPVQLRTEIQEDDFIHIIQIISLAEINLPTGEHFKGVLVDTDTIYQRESGDFWSNFNDLLDISHQFNKKLFFRLLKQSTIEWLEPEY
jgi:uncharacterized protein (TIGR04255 family)